MSTLKKLLDAAVQNEIEIRRLSSQSGALSAKAYLAACSAAPASKAEADAIEEALAAHPDSPMHSSLRRMCKAICDFARTGPIQKLGGYIGDDVDGALVGLGATRASLFLVAARIVTKLHPELFGTLNSLADLNAANAKALSERERLRAEISTAWSPADVTWDRDGRVSFRMTGGVIAVCDGFAENLVNWCVAERDMAAAA